MSLSTYYLIMLSSPPPSPQPAGAVDTFGEGGAGSGGGLAEEPRSLRLVTKSHGTVVVQRAHFHNLVERNGCYFHVAPEATSPGGKVQLCSRCSRCRSRTARDFTRRESEGVIDPHFLQHNPSFYRHGAPPDCIASGYDVGVRFLRGAGDGDAVIDLADTSALEMLCLASHRLHHVSSKLSSGRERLESNTIVFPQTFGDGASVAPGDEAGNLEATLRAAFGQMQARTLCHPRSHKRHPFMHTRTQYAILRTCQLPKITVPKMSCFLRCMSTIFQRGHTRTRTHAPPLRCAARLRGPKRDQDVVGEVGAAAPHNAPSARGHLQRARLPLFPTR